MTTEQELTQRMRQTIRVSKSVLTVLFNQKGFAVVNLLPQGMSFTAVSFVDSVIIPLAIRHTRQRGTSPTANLIYISTVPSATLLGMSYKRSPGIWVSVFPIGHIHPTWLSQISGYISPTES
jgi:hypothetical protein